MRLRGSLISDIIYFNLKEIICVFSDSSVDQEHHVKT